MIYVTAVLVVTVLASVVGWSSWQLLQIVLEWRRRKRAEREVWARFRAEVNRERLGVTPVDQIPPAWLRKRGGR